MIDQHKSPEREHLNRRTLLKAAAVTTVGAGMFSGTASAEGPKDFQVNFCGCSQVCLEKRQSEESPENPGSALGPVTVFVAEETDDGWEFTGNEYSNTGLVCDDSGEMEGKKIIAAAPSKEGDEPPFPKKVCFVCNPTPCAAKALEAYKRAYYEENGMSISCVNESASGPTFGDFEENCGGRPYDVTVVRGGCGQPGRRPGPPDRESQDGKGKPEGRSDAPSRGRGRRGNDEPGGPPARGRRGR